MPTADKKQSDKLTGTSRHNRSEYYRSSNLHSL